MQKWKIDPDHSVASFAIRHMMIAFVHGQINSISGFLLLDPDDICSLRIDMEIDVSGILTGIKKRDDHLKSAEFFDEQAHSKITYKNTAAERTGFNSCKVTGDLTILGITKPLSIDVNILGPVKSPFDETVTIGISGNTRLNREDFGLSWNVQLGKGGLMVARDVDVSVNIEADLVK